MWLVTFTTSFTPETKPRMELRTIAALRKHTSSKHSLLLYTCTLRSISSTLFVTLVYILYLIRWDAAKHLFFCLAHEPRCNSLHILSRSVAAQVNQAFQRKLCYSAYELLTCANCELFTSFLYNVKHISEALSFCKRNSVKTV